MSVISLTRRLKAPDVGTLFDYNGGSYRVTSWLKAMPNQSDITMDQIMAQAIKDDQALSPAVIDLILASAQQRVGPRREKLIGCTRDDAEYVSGYGVCGCIAPIEDIRITGRVNWPTHVIDEYRQQALRLVGEPVF
jgi:hypothetical protein